MQKHGEIPVDTTLADYLVSRLQADEAFLVERQKSLNVNTQEEHATWQYLRGKRDMCKQFLLYLEEIQRAAHVEISTQPVPETPSQEHDAASHLFHYPDDYDVNE